MIRRGRSAGVLLREQERRPRTRFPRPWTGTAAIGPRLAAYRVALHLDRDVSGLRQADLAGEQEKLSRRYCLGLHGQQTATHGRDHRNILLLNGFSIYRHILVTLSSERDTIAENGRTVVGASRVLKRAHLFNQQDRLSAQPASFPDSLAPYR